VPIFHTPHSVTDVLACAVTKGAANCDKQCELQNSVNQPGHECALGVWDILERMLASVSGISDLAAMSKLWGRADDMCLRASVRVCPWHAQQVRGEQHLSRRRAACCCCCEGHFFVFLVSIQLFFVFKCFSTFFIVFPDISEFFAPGIFVVLLTFFCARICCCAPDIFLLQIFLLCSRHFLGVKIVRLFHFFAPDIFCCSRLFSVSTDFLLRTSSFKGQIIRQADAIARCFGGARFESA